MIEMTKCIDCAYCVYNEILYPDTKYGCIVDDVSLIQYILYQESWCDYFIRKTMEVEEWM